MTPNAGHAKARALVAYTTPTGGTGHGRLIAVGGRKHSARTCRIVLASGAVINRQADQVRLVPEPPRAAP